MKCFTLEGVTKEYGGRKVLDIPSLQIDESEAAALLGPNGAGKTTLLAILACLVRPTSGSVLYRAGPPPRSERERRKLRQEVVMVDQDPVMFSSSVLANMEFGLKARGIEAGERQRRIAEALELVGLQDRLHAPAHRLSGGETRRVAVARALALSPRVLLCDEPTSNVDAENRAIIQDTLRHIASEDGRTVLFTTHDRSEAERLAGRLITLDGGKVVEGAWDNVFSARVVRRRDSRVSCLLYSGISLEAVFSGDTFPGSRVRLVVDPGRIAVGTGEDRRGGGSLVSGRVRQVTELNGRMMATVDAGLWFTVHLPAADYRDRPFSAGETVTLSVPPEAVTLLP